MGSERKDFCSMSCAKPDTVASMVLALRAALVQKPVPFGTHDVAFSEG